MIGMYGGKDSGKSVLSAQLDDNIWEHESESDGMKKVQIWKKHEALRE